MITRSMSMLAVIIGVAVTAAANPIPVHGWEDCWEAVLGLEGPGIEPILATVVTMRSSNPRPTWRTSRASVTARRLSSTSAFTIQSPQAGPAGSEVASRRAVSRPAGRRSPQGRTGSLCGTPGSCLQATAA